MSGGGGGPIKLMENNMWGFYDTNFLTYTRRQIINDQPGPRFIKLKRYEVS